MARDADDDAATPKAKVPKGGTAPMQAVVRTDDDGIDSHEAGVASTVALPIVPEMRPHQIQPTKPSELAMTECPICHVATPVARFCSDCGAPLVLRRFCSDCGAHLKQGAKFCDACGQKVS